MGRVKQFIEIEKKLELKYSGVKENEVQLRAEDFNDGKLSSAGYLHLKQQCEYIPYSDQIEIIIPRDAAIGFRANLEQMAAAELVKIKKDKKHTSLMALFLLALGIAWYVVGYVLVPSAIVREVTIIATWVFVWSAVEKWFFERNKLQDRRFSLLQILAARVKARE